MALRRLHSLLTFTARTCLACGTSRLPGTHSPIDYATLPDGAQVTFSSNHSDIVDALHDWFEAQLSDHGDDAEHG